MSEIKLTEDRAVSSGKVPYNFWLLNALLLILLWPASVGYWVLNSTVYGYWAESLAVLSVAMMMFMAGLPFWRSLIPFDWGLVAGCCVVLAAFAVSSSVAAVHPTWSLGHGAADIMLALGTFGAAAALRSAGDRLVNDVLHVLILSMLLYLVFYAWFAANLVERAGGRAVYSFFPFMNVRRFTNVLAPMVAVCLALWATHGGMRGRFGVLYLASAAVFTTTLIWTGGRAPVLAVCGSVIIIAILSEAKLRWRLLRAALFIFLISSLVSLGLPRLDPHFSFWTRTFSSEKWGSVAEFSSNRLWLWQETARLIADRPLFGYGYKQWNFHHPDFIHHGSAHNFPLQIVFDFGLVGGGAAVLLVFCFWITRLKQLKGGDPNFVASVAGLSVMILQSCVDGIFTWRSSMQLVFLFFAISAKIASNGEERRDILKADGAS